MAATTPLLTALLKKSTIEDHNDLVKASNAALVKNKSDREAQKVKTIALVKLERYEEAVAFVEKGAAEVKGALNLEYAYALYKLGRLDEALKAVAGVSSRGGRHLEAQVRYKLEDAEGTSRVYEEIASEVDKEEEFDLRVNRSAVEALGHWLKTADATKRPGREDLEYFETAYNAACGSIARGELGQAEVLLKRAKELCRHSEELSEDQKQDEILSITVQQAYVLHALGKKEEADAVTKEIQTDAVADASTRAIAQSNVLIGSKTENPFLVHKTFNSTLTIPHSDKLFSYQAVPYESNRRTIDIQAMKFEGMKTPAKAPEGSSAVSPEVLLSSVFSAASHARNEISKAAIKKVLPELSKRPVDIGLVLTIVQMYILTGNATAATELLETLFKRLDDSTKASERELRYTPGLVAVLISLYQSQARRSQIRQELAKTASYWLDKPNGPGSLLQAAGSSLLETTDPEHSKIAAEIFTRLREQKPDDKAAVAGFVASHAGDEAASSDANKLTSIADLTRNVDVDTLENDGIPRPANALAQLTRARKRAAPDSGPTKPKRLRKSRLPKDYDPDKKPDPERWLTMKDRSYYRPPKGRKKGKKGGDDRTQGGAVNENLNIDAKPASGAAAGAGGGAGGGGGGGKKKGKKR